MLLWTIPSGTFFETQCRQCTNRPIIILIKCVYRGMIRIRLSLHFYSSRARSITSV